MSLLQIYDHDDALMRFTGTSRPADLTIGVSGGIKGLRSELDNLVASGKTFDRCVFHTHGNKGLIAFNHEHIRAKEWRTIFAGRNYEKIFPEWSRIYFVGCQVSGGSEGKEFLVAAGQVFL